MAARNTEPYIRECLDSILAQTYENWELVVVNDHSTDRTREILLQYGKRDTRIRIFDSTRPRLIPTLKEGQKYLQGELINRMDSDDKMPPDKLESLYQVWQKHGKGSVVAGGTEHFVDEGEVGDGFKRYDAWLNKVARTESHYQEIYRECVIPSHCWLIHRDDFFAVDAFNPEVYPEDYDLCFRFYRAGLKIIGLNKILHYWRDRSDRISRTWQEYEDNRYFEMKLRYFYELDRVRSRPLVLWGGGRNGKDMARLLQKRGDHFNWVCDNPNKIGKDIYGVKMESYQNVPSYNDPQIMIVVTSPNARLEIEAQLANWGKEPVHDYWFFA